MPKILGLQVASSGGTQVLQVAFNMQEYWD